MDNSAVNDDWRQWIAENLALGISVENLTASMVTNGIPRAIALAEIGVATQNPYFIGGQLATNRIQTRLKKLSWFLENQRNLNHQSGLDLMIDRRSKLTTQEFYKEYYFVNKPVIITGMLEDWQAISKWTLTSLKERFGDRMVQVQNGRDRDAAYEIDQNNYRSLMSFSQYLSKIEADGLTNDYYMTANNNSSNRQALKELWAEVGRIPEYLDPHSPDDGFLWIGPAGTRTPFHHDLTNNFMAQIMGSKKINLIAPCESGYVYNHLHCYSDVGGPAIDYERFPMMENVTISECILAAGEILFLPVGWWHYVEALSPSITMSFINFQHPNNAASYYSTYGPI